MQERCDLIIQNMNTYYFAMMTTGLKKITLKQDSVFLKAMIKSERSAEKAKQLRIIPFLNGLKSISATIP